MTPHRFLVDNGRVRSLSATRQGRVSLGGFAYQAGYAVARLASLATGRPVLDLPEVPSLLRYDWAEDLDEVDQEGRTVLTQCKRIAEIGRAASLADVLLGFSPKWLWTPEDRRRDLRFRLVCTDPRFRGMGPVLLSACRPQPAEDEVTKAMLAALGTPPGARSDRALWQREAEACGLEGLCKALWEQTEVLYLPAEPLPDDPAGPLLRAERAALDLLLRMQEVAPSRQRPALDALRSLIHGNVVEFDPLGSRSLPPLDREPAVLGPDDVRYALLPFRFPVEEELPFEIVSQAFLRRVAAEPKRLYVARRPRWADVVHGGDDVIKFLEREQTEPLVRQVREELLPRLGEGEALPLLFVLGAPGAGKTTLVRRVAARLVQEGLVVVAAPKLNLDRLEKEDFGSFLEGLRRLEDGSLPVLLVLDDPLFAESGWIDLLRKLARSSRRIAVLAASPEYLFREHGYALQGGGQMDCRTVSLPRPPREEREAIARLHGRDPEVFGRKEEDFLVLAMEASTGQSFESLIDRIWFTLNQGLPIAPGTRPDGLPWLVRAYLMVCYWHRLYLTCPGVLLRAVLDRTGNDRPAGGFRFELQRLASEQGWAIFNFSEPEAPYLRFLMARIGASHQRVAAEAWRRRPAAAFDVGEWVLQASLEAQAAALELGALAVQLERDKAPGEAGLLDRLIELWTRAAREGTVETRNLCLLHTSLFPTVSRRLAAGLEACVARKDGQSWLAALSLIKDRTGGSPVSAQDLPWLQGLDLLELIRVADLHLAPLRATELLMILRDLPELSEVFFDRISATSDHPNAGHLLARLVSVKPGDDDAVERGKSWVRAHSGHRMNSELLARLAAARPGDAVLAEEVVAWMGQNPGHPNACRMLLPFVENERMRSRAVEWIDKNPAHPEVHLLLAALLGRARGAEEEALLRQIDDYLSRATFYGSTKVLLALLGREDPRPEHVDRVIRKLPLGRRRGRGKVLMSLARVLVSDLPAAMRLLARDSDPSRKTLLMGALGNAIKDQPRLLGPLLKAMGVLQPADADLLLAHLLRVESELLEDFLAARLADPRFQGDDGTLLRALRRRPHVRDRLLARAGLGEKARRALLEASEEPRSPSIIETLG